MKKWITKSLAITVAFLTFGLITPNHEIWANFEEPILKKSAVNVYEPSTNDISDTYQLDELIVGEISPLENLLIGAKEQSYIKFGQKITPVIADEFEEIIFPKMSKAIEMTLASFPKDKVYQLAISNSPSGDYKEKIFNVYDTKSGKDVLRFHVRLENRPFDGHYYNFHYHTYEDQFTAHFDLGEIYYSKNQPPKWLS